MEISGTGGLPEQVEGRVGPLKTAQQRIRFQNTLAASRAVDVRKADQVEISRAKDDIPQAIPGHGNHPLASTQKIWTSLNRIVKAYQAPPESGLDIVR